MDFKIQRADNRHLRDINRLTREARIGTGAHVVENTWFVRNSEGRIIAFAKLDFVGNDAAILHGIVVEREYRHRGIGSALINHRIQVARRRGIKLFALVTMYYLFNFYKRRGFQTRPRADLPEAIRDYWMFTSARYKKCAVMIRRSR